MKNICFLLFLAWTSFHVQAQKQTANFTVSPALFDATDQVTLTVSGIDVTQWNSSELYLWMWYFDSNDNQVGNSPNNGAWGNSDPTQQLTNNGDGTYSFAFTPSDLFNDPNIGKIGLLVKTDDGSGQTQDFLMEVGTFQLTLNNPTKSRIIINKGDKITIAANTTKPANFELRANGTLVQTQNNTKTFSFQPAVTENTDFELSATSVANGTVLSEEFKAIVAPTPNEAPVPPGMKDGINFDPSYATTATFVLYAPGKKFVHLIGNFHGNNWTIDNTYLLNYDANQNRFWITLNNLTKDNILFQYVVDGSIRVADPYSELVIDEYNDKYIGNTTFTGIPAYPVGKTKHMISWLRTNPQPYQWQNTSFERPKQEDLIIYELLIRDFVNEHSFEAVEAKLDYLQNLGVNAIELMPVNEFDGNISWGYNPAFHMALDKYYGTKNDLKSLIDAAHARGMAVILDVVYNHATGQNPYYRMWNDCAGCYNGKALPENPFFNVSDPNSAFQFFNDIDHESPATQAYIDRLNKYWLTEYNIDGFRFDFTKGFTNTPGDGGSYDQTRIGVLTRMYDQIRAVDPTAYVILEHFAPNSEETALIEHRATDAPNEPGMLVWSNHNYNYNEATMGYNSNSDFSSISYKKRGWTTPSNIGYFESHDEERLMYKTLMYGGTQGTYDVTAIGTALERMELAGAFFFTIPGPKMIWQFGELGYDFSINHCADGTNNSDCRTAPKPIRWDYLDVAERKAIYDTWAKLIQLRHENAIFGTDQFTLDVDAANGLKSIHLTTSGSDVNALKYVTVIGNFGLITQSIVPNFQQKGTWVNLMDGSYLEVQDVNAPIELAPGAFKIFGYKENLAIEDFDTALPINLYPNPTSTHFQISKQIDELVIYNLLGQRIKSFQGKKYPKDYKFDISGISSGFYLIQARSKNEKYSGKLIIQN